jgi:4-hydroxy-tetrahydrodipicolinate synthase
MNETTLTGVMTALITPFQENGQIDWDSFDQLIQQQEAAGVDGIVISGTTGEAPTLEVQEKLALIRRARANVKSSIKIIAGTGNNNTQQSVELSKLAVDAGADALLIVTPPYNKPSLAGLSNHFAMIGKATDCPLILYHVPGRTGQKLSADAMSRLCQIPQIKAIKEASADLVLFSQTKIQSQSIMLSGDDPTYLASLAVGGHGIISVTTNIFPKAFVAMTQAFAKGEHETACQIHEALMPMIEVLFCEANPGPVKAALAMAGLCRNHLRPPLAPVEPENADRIQTVFEQTRKQLSAMGGHVV